mmetsp:Transcript_26476/g.85223  ORF Transcript_26476/g.85223 Transcript_26476/m.85223 type:complete len:242 (+) Transcript_26476:902-1627(+)
MTCGSTSSWVASGRRPLPKATRRTRGRATRQSPPTAAPRCSSLVASRTRTFRPTTCGSTTGARGPRWRQRALCRRRGGCTARSRPAMGPRWSSLAAPPLPSRRWTMCGRTPSRARSGPRWSFRTVCILRLRAGCTLRSCSSRWRVRRCWSTVVRPTTCTLTTCGPSTWTMNRGQKRMPRRIRRWRVRGTRWWRWVRRAVAARVAVRVAARRMAPQRRGDCCRVQSQSSDSEQASHRSTRLL